MDVSQADAFDTFLFNRLFEYWGEKNPFWDLQDNYKKKNQRKYIKNLNVI